jgi:hypothetical protein
MPGISLPPFRELPRDARQEQRARLTALVANERPPVLARSRAPSPLRLSIIVVAAALAGVAFALVPAQLTDRASLTLIDRAMAAISSGPVLHAVLEIPMSEITLSPEPRLSSIIDPRTGRERPIMTRTEIWYDANGERLRQVHSVEGAIVADWVQSAGAADRSGAAPGQRPVFDPALAAFFKGYKHALADHTAAENGSGVIEGRSVKWLRFPATKEIGLAREVAVDAETYQPVLLRPVCPYCEATPTYRIRTLEGVSESAADFATAKVPDREPAAAVSDAEWETVSVQTAASALGRPPLWAGAAVDGVELSRVTLVHATRHSAMPPTAANEISRGRGLKFSYGGMVESGQLVHKPNQRWFTISESDDYRHGFAGFNFNNAEAGEALTMAHSPVPSDGQLVLQYVDDGLWTAQFKKSGLYIEIDGSSRPLVLAAAKSLRPVSEPRR